MITTVLHVFNFKCLMFQIEHRQGVEPVFAFNICCIALNASLCSSLEHVLAFKMCSLKNIICVQVLHTGSVQYNRTRSRCSIKEWVSFFLGSWDMNRSAEQTNRVNREAVLVRFVCSALRFISHEPRKKDTHSLYLQCLQQRPLLKFSEQSKKFKFPAEIGHLTLFPDRTIIAYSFRQNSAWINGEKVVCCECFHTLKQY